ncbi:hypothetical protein [Shewanella vaxholmensis]|uniref:RiboL-PSP-HEPN domain-containing protein n=1 Tax=Shewanella vaxholmensis TaxID=3063535 RepID=A0ABU9UX64_9GAMM
MFTKKNLSVEKNINLLNFKERTEYELQYLRSYIVDISEAISEKGVTLEEQMIADLDSRPNDEAVLVDLFEKEISKLKSYFHHSSIVLVYTLLESSLSHLSDEIRNFTNSKLLLQDLNDNNLIGKSIKYINLICDIDLKKEKRLYDRICEFQQLRNQIVHQNSRVKGNTPEALAKNAKALEVTFSGIKINYKSWDFHVTDNTLIKELVDVVDEFLCIAIKKVNSQIFIVEI